MSVHFCPLTAYCSVQVENWTERGIDDDCYLLIADLCVFARPYLGRQSELRRTALHTARSAPQPCLLLHVRLLGASPLPLVQRSVHSLLNCSTKQIAVRVHAFGLSWWHSLPHFFWADLDPQFALLAILFRLLPV